MLRLARNCAQIISVRLLRRQRSQLGQGPLIGYTDLVNSAQCFAARNLSPLQLQIVQQLSDAGSLFGRDRGIDLLRLVVFRLLRAPLIVNGVVLNTTKPWPFTQCFVDALPSQTNTLKSLWISLRLVPLEQAQVRPSGSIAAKLVWQSQRFLGGAKVHAQHRSAFSGIRGTKLALRGNQPDVDRLDPIF
ncbi:MAG: hypothetical protein EXR77_13870 [Myxococcales bacterium]|nr:hypothetical protein [Myxococcales bacterium]